MVATADPVIAEAATKVRFFSQDETAIIQQQQHDLAMHDRATREQTAREQGRLDDKIEVAQRMISMGLSLDEVSAFTGVPFDTLVTLKPMDS